MSKTLLTCAVLAVCVAGVSAQADLGLNWIRLVGRQGCSFSGWLGTLLCEEAGSGDGLVLWAKAGGVRSTWLTVAPQAVTEPAALPGVPLTFQLVGRAGACPRRSFLTASSVCANASLTMGPGQGSRWVLQRSRTVPGAFLIRFEGRAGCPARFLGARTPRGPAPACGDPGLRLHPNNGDPSVLLSWTVDYPQPPRPPPPKPKPRPPPPKPKPRPPPPKPKPRPPPPKPQPRPLPPKPKPRPPPPKPKPPPPKPRPPPPKPQPRPPPPKPKPPSPKPSPPPPKPSLPPPSPPPPSPHSSPPPSPPPPSPPPNPPPPSPPPPSPPPNPPPPSPPPPSPPPSPPPPIAPEWVVVGVPQRTGQATGPLSPVHTALEFPTGVQAENGPSVFFASRFSGNSYPSIATSTNRFGSLIWNSFITPDSTSESVGPIDMVYDPASSQAHLACITENDVGTSGWPLYFLYNGFFRGSFSVVARVVAVDVAVAVDLDGLPVVAYATTAATASLLQRQIAVMKQSSGSWLAYTTSGGQPRMPLVSGGVRYPARAVDLAVDAATGRLFLAALGEVIPPPFNTPGATGPLLRVIVLFSSLLGGDWAQRDLDGGGLANPNPATATISLALSPTGGVPHVATTKTSPTLNAIVVAFNPVTLEPNTLPIPDSLGGPAGSPFQSVAPTLAFGPGGELYLAVQRLLDGSPTSSTPTVLKYDAAPADGSTYWVSVGDPSFALNLFGSSTLSQPAVRVHPITGEPWVSFLKNNAGDADSSLVVMQYTTP